MMFKLFIIGLGGFFGAISRYAFSGWILRSFENSYFPYGTLAVNLLGCLAIGFLAEVSELKQIFNPEIRLLIFIGFLGSFTTFSTFGLEVFNLLRDGSIIPALLNLAAHIFLGLLAVWIGIVLARLI